ncbi:MAG: hypothetical protein VX185_05590 [Pseudomonadota bacterium]|nr:hypothetical protein [Pseudomonadota bacterium]
MPNHIQSLGSNSSQGINQAPSRINHNNNFNPQAAAQSRAAMYSQQMNDAPAVRRLNAAQIIMQRLFTNLVPVRPGSMINLGHVQEIKPGLVVSQITDKDNKAMWLVREELTPARFEHWLDYIDVNANAARCFRSALDMKYDLQQEPLDPGFCDEDKFFSSFNESQVIDTIVQQHRLSPLKAEKLATQLDNTYTGSAEFDGDTRQDGEKRYAVYISSRPVNNFAFDHIDRLNSRYDDNLMKMESYLHMASHISMAVSSGIKDGCVEHRGIFKTTVATLNNQNAQITTQDQRNIKMSMILHFFGMEAGRKINGADKFFVSPARIMSNIFAQCMQPELESGAIIEGLDNIKNQGLGQYIREHDVEAAIDGFEKQYLCDLTQIQNPIFS